MRNPRRSLSAIDARVLRRPDGYQSACDRRASVPNPIGALASLRVMLERAIGTMMKYLLGLVLFATTLTSASAAMVCGPGGCHHRDYYRARPPGYYRERPHYGPPQHCFYITGKRVCR